VISIDGCLDSFIVDVRVLGGSGHEHVGRNVVGALHEDWNAVKLKVKGASEAIQIKLPDPVNCPYPIPCRLRVHNLRGPGAISEL